MRHVMKFAHFLGLAGFIGALGVALALAANAPTSTAEAFAHARESIQVAGNYVALPALVIVITSGMLMLVTTPALIDARWVWAKAALGLALSGTALMGWLPAVNHAADAARSAAFGNPALRMQDAAVAAEWRWGWVTLVLALAAMVFGVWRPRLRRAVPGG
jgi:hypothetical protein